MLFCQSYIMAFFLDKKKKTINIWLVLIEQIFLYIWLFRAFHSEANYISSGAYLQWGKLMQVLVITVSDDILTLLWNNLTFNWAIKRVYERFEEKKGRKKNKGEIN